MQVILVFLFPWKQSKLVFFLLVKVPKNVLNFLWDGKKKAHIDGDKKCVCFFNLARFDGKKVWNLFFNNFRNVFIYFKNTF